MCTGGLGAHFGLPQPPPRRQAAEGIGGIPRFFAGAPHPPRRCYVRHTAIEAANDLFREAERRPCGMIAGYAILGAMSEGTIYMIVYGLSFIPVFAASLGMRSGTW